MAGHESIGSRRRFPFRLRPVPGILPFAGKVAERHGFTVEAANTVLKR